jgi:ribonuclease G
MQWLEQRRIGETLRAGVEAGALVELHLARASDPLPFGSVHDAVVRGKDGARLLIDCNATSAWLINSPQHPIGHKLPGQVVRAPITEPGAVKRAHLIEHRGLAMVVPEAQTIRDFPDSFEVEDWCDRAISGTIPFDGGSLSLERTRAGLVIDVDGSGGNHAINLAAATTIAAVLRLFQISGMVMVDLVTPDNRKQRLELDAALDAALRKDPRSFERTAINGFGLVQIVRAKRGPSLIDVLCGMLHHAPSIETQALHLLNDAARSIGAGTRTLMARPDIINWIEKNPSLLDKLRQAVGADAKMAADENIRGHGHVHVQPV